MRTYYIKLEHKIIPKLVSSLIRVDQNNLGVKVLTIVGSNSKPCESMLKQYKYPA